MNNLNPVIAGEQRLHPVFSEITKSLFGLVNTQQVEENIRIDSWDKDTSKTFVVISWHWSYETGEPKRTVVRLIEWIHQVEFEKRAHPGENPYYSSAFYFLMKEDIIPMAPEYCSE